MAFGRLPVLDRYGKRWFSEVLYTRLATLHVLECTLKELRNLIYRSRDCYGDELAVHYILYYLNCKGEPCRHVLELTACVDRIANEMESNE